MKHARKAIVLLAVLLTFCCLSAPAWARVYFPKSLKEIGDEAFMGVPLPKYYAIPSGTETIGSRAFSNTGVEMFWLPATLKEVASDAFDAGTAFVCSPGTYAERWCQETGVDYDYIKPSVSADNTSLRYGEEAVLTANYVFNDEPTEYLWESRERERYWSPILDEKGPTLRYVNTEEQGYIQFRVSAVSGGVCSVPSNSLSIYRYADSIGFLPDKCKALNGDTVYLEWGFLGKDANYILYQWSPDEQNPKGGEWTGIDSFQGGWNRTVYGLDKNTTYQFRIGLYEDGDVGLVSEPVTVTTGSEETKFEMREFAVIGTSAHMSWEPIHNAVYDIFLGSDRNNLALFSSNWKSTSYSVYNFTLGATKYLQVRARIPNAGFTYWGPILEVTPTEEGPFVSIESCEVKGGVVNLAWTPLNGCTYDVFLRLDGQEEFCAATNISRNYLDLSGLQPGDKGTVYVMAKCGKWYALSPEREIQIDPPNDVEYRALLIGEVSFKGSMYSGRCYGDVERLTEMLQNVKTPSGTYYSIVRRQDLNREQVLSAIQETFGGADENDVSLLYFGTHGDVGLVGRYAGSLCTVEVPNEVYGTLLMEELAAALENVKGTKVVWLGSCGSGAGVYDTEEEENVADPYSGEYDEEEWDDWYEYDINDYPAALQMSDMEVFDTGELRLPNFQVLTAARYRFVSWGREAENYTFFVRFLTEGVYGPDGSMPADLDNDGRLTQHELFTYIKLREEDPEQGADQDVQTYPMGSDYVLFIK